MNEQLPTVSVIIPSYDSGDTIRRAIDSVVGQTYQNYEIIVVDDGSTDATREILADYIQDKKIRYFYQENKGCGAARNYGAQVATGELLAFLDADDYWDSKKLELQVQVLVNNPECVVCSTEAMVITPEGKIVPIKRNNVNRPRSGNVLFHLVFHNIITLSSSIVRTKSFKKIGGFTEEYDLMMFEDYYLWLRLAPLGKFESLKEPLVFYQTRYSLAAEKERYNHRKVAKIFMRCMKAAPFYLKPLYLLGLTLSYIKSLYLFQVIRKMGIKGIVLELKRRTLRHIDFLFYASLIRRLRTRAFLTIDDICNFSYRESFGLLVPGQIESEIKRFLEIGKRIDPRSILEIGTAHGGNLFLLAKLIQREGIVVSVDLPGGEFGGGYFARKEVVYQNFVSAPDRIVLLRGNSQQDSMFQSVISSLPQNHLDILFIDADHTYEGVKADFIMYGPLVRKGGIIAFHDIANAPAENYGVQQFWNEIKHGYKFEEIISDPNQKGYGIGILYVA